MDTKVVTHEDIIEAMMAEHAQNELAAEERRRQEEAEIERQKYAMFGKAIALIRSIGALNDEEIDALFTGARVELENVGAEREEILLISPTLPSLRIRVFPRLSGSESARLFVAAGNLYKSADIWEPEHRALALEVVAKAVEIAKMHEANARYTERMRSQS